MSWFIFSALQHFSLLSLALTDVSNFAVTFSKVFPPAFFIWLFTQMTLLEQHISASSPTLTCISLSFSLPLSEAGMESAFNIVPYLILSLHRKHSPLSSQMWGEKALKSEPRQRGLLKCNSYFYRNTLFDLMREIADSFAVITFNVLSWIIYERPQ